MYKLDDAQLKLLIRISKWFESYIEYTPITRLAKSEIKYVKTLLSDVIKTKRYDEGDKVDLNRIRRWYVNKRID